MEWTSLHNCFDILQTEPQFVIWEKVSVHLPGLMPPDVSYISQPGPALLEPNPQENCYHTTLVVLCAGRTFTMTFQTKLGNTEAPKKL